MTARNSAVATDEINETYRKVCDAINGYRSYHTAYCTGDESWSADGKCVSFNVHGWSDSGDGSEWDERWAVYDDGSIYGGGCAYGSFEEFELKWN